MRVGALILFLSGEMQAIKKGVAVLELDPGAARDLPAPRI
jgi:hypothetical protein